VGSPHQTTRFEAKKTILLELPTFISSLKHTCPKIACA
jgi:hypothetical protein